MAQTLPIEPILVNRSKRKTSPRVLRIDFGDGYNQRSGDGLNTMPEMWDFYFQCDKDDWTTLIDFFEDHGGTTYWQWTGPTGLIRKYIAKSWNETFIGGVGNAELKAVEIHAIVEQVYDS